MLPDQQIAANSRLGLIGLGHLGSPIARRLAARFPLVVYDRDRSKAEELRTLGAAIADDPRKLATDVDVVLSCLPDGAAVEDLYLGSGNVLRSARPGAEAGADVPLFAGCPEDGCQEVLTEPTKSNAASEEPD